MTIGTGAAAQKADVALDAVEPDGDLDRRRSRSPKGPTEIHIRYTGILNDQLRGFYLSKANNRKYAVTQFEATDARRAFPCFDEPAFKATFALTLTIDRGDTAISNGRVLSDTPGPPHAAHDEVRDVAEDVVRISSRWPSATSSASSGAEGVPIRICATPDKKDLGRIALDSAQQILTFYNGYYAIKYPFGKLDVVAVPDFAAGAMENTAAIFYRETALLADSKTASVGTRKKIASILAHEMAHQWFGNLVTMQWWDDLWLNEGFATWMANKPLAAARSDWNMPVDEALENQSGAEPRFAEVDAPDSRRRPDSGADRRGVRRDRLREGRRRSAHDRELRRRRHLPARRQRVSRSARLQQRHVGGFLESALGDVGQAGRSHSADVRQPARRAADRRVAVVREQPDDGDAQAAAIHARLDAG